MGGNKSLPARAVTAHWELEPDFHAALYKRCPEPSAVLIVPLTCHLAGLRDPAGHSWDVHYRRFIDEFADKMPPSVLVAMGRPATGPRDMPSVMKKLSDNLSSFQADEDLWKSDLLLLYALCIACTNYRLADKVLISAETKEDEVRWLVKHDRYLYVIDAGSIIDREDTRDTKSWVTVASVMDHVHESLDVMHLIYDDKDPDSDE
jgi:hypothetical protein